MLGWKKEDKMRLTIIGVVQIIILFLVLLMIVRNTKAIERIAKELVILSPKKLKKRKPPEDEELEIDPEMGR